MRFDHVTPQVQGEPMRTKVSASPSLVFAGLLTAGLLLTGCAGSNNAEETASPTPSASSKASTTASAPASSSASATSAPQAPAPGPADGVALCTADKLSAAVEDTAGGGAAGSAYRTLVLTNTSGQPCSTAGYAGVSYIDAAGKQVGAAAERSTGTPESVITLEPGQSAGAVLRETRPENYGDSCGLTPVAGLRIYPPEDTAWLDVARPGNGCSSEEIMLLGIDRFQAR